MSGPKRNPDKLNTIGVVVVGICGAVMVYVTIVALQAFYMNDTSEIQTMADYGGQDVTAKSHKADEMRNIGPEVSTNGVAPGMPQTYRIPIDDAIDLIVRDAKDTNPEHPADHLVPVLPPAVKVTVKPIFSRGQPLDTPPTAPPAPPTDGAGSGAGSASVPDKGSGAGSAAVPAKAPDKGGHPAPAKAPDKGPAHPAPVPAPAPGGHAP
jgi:hypothetical protein